MANKVILITFEYFIFFDANFFLYVTATTDIYTLSLHDALPISSCSSCFVLNAFSANHRGSSRRPSPRSDRKSTRLNSSHVEISYAVFCLKKKRGPHQLFR